SDCRHYTIQRRRANYSVSNAWEHSDPRQRLPTQKLERRTAAGRDMRDALADARFLDGRDRVASADDGRALHTGAGRNASTQNPPIGPFHTTVLASPSAAEYASTVFGPMSRPMRSPMAGSS